MSELDRSGLVLFHDYTQGHCQDLSGNENHGVLTNSGGLGKTKRGYGYTANALTGYISIANFGSEFTDDKMTVAFSIDDNSRWTDTESILSCRTGNNFILYFDASSITIFNDVATSSVLLSSYIGNIQTIIIENTSIAVAKVYVNGIYIASFGVLVPLNSLANATWKIGNELIVGLNRPIKKPLLSMAIYNTDKSTDQVAAIHSYLANLKTPVTPTSNLRLSPSRHAGEKGMVSGWNMEKVANKVVDAKGGNHGTITPSNELQQSVTPWGEPTLLWSGNKSQYVNCGNNSELNFTTETFGGWIWVNASTWAGANVLMNRGFGNTDGYTFYGAPIIFRTHQAGAQQPVSSIITPTVERWYLAGFLSVSGGQNRVYINGIDNSSSDVIRVNPLTTTKNFYLGVYNNLTSYHKGSIAAPFIGTFSSKAEFDVAIKEEYNRVARAVIYQQDWSNAPLTYTALGAGSTIPGTDAEIYSGTFKISWDATLNKKVLECVTAGYVFMPAPQGNALYGTFEFKGKVTTNTLLLQVVQHKIPFNVSPQNGYYIGYGFNRVNSYGTTNGVAFGLMYSAIEIYPGNWYTFKLTRSTEGLFYTYKDGNLAVPIAGFNPTNSPIHTNAKYYCLSMTAGDKVSYIKKLFGVPIS